MRTQWRHTNGNRWKVTVWEVCMCSPARARVTVCCAAAKVLGMKEAQVPACAETTLAVTATAPKKRKVANNEGAPGSSSANKRGRLSPSAGWHWLCCSGSESSCQASDVSRRVTRRKKLRKSKTSLCRSLRSSSAWFGVLCRTHVLAA